jgi:hypothetical protein
VLYNEATKEQLLQATCIAKDKAYAMVFLKRADLACYGLLFTNLENQYTLGADKYPTTVADTYNSCELPKAHDCQLQPTQGQDT